MACSVNFAPARDPGVSGFETTFSFVETPSRSGRNPCLGSPGTWLAGGAAFDMSNTPVGLSSLVERVRRGEIAALGKLYESEASHLLALAVRLTADRLVAEAVVHEVFCTLWRYPNSVGHDVRDYLVQSTLKLVQAATAARRRKRVVSRVRCREEPLDLRSRE